MTKEATPEQQELLKILIHDKTKLQSDIDKLDVVKRHNIEGKVNNYIAKKQKKIESIQGKVNENFMQTHTFSPQLIKDDQQSPQKKKFRTISR